MTALPAERFTRVAGARLQFPLQDIHHLQGAIQMRVAILIKANRDTEAGVMPSTELLTAMGAYNEALVDAGIMLSGDGLKPSSNGARVSFDGDERSVSAGKFPATNRIVAGFWLWQVNSMEEAVEWVKRCPNPTGAQSEIEIRPVFEADDFGAELTPELREQEERLRVRTDANG